MRKGVALAKDSDSKKQQEREQIKNAEKKYQSLVQRRNELNDMAKVVREERDMLNKKRGELKTTSDKVKKERDELVGEMRKHKEERNKFQQQAKNLIQTKQKKRGAVVPNLSIRVEELKADIQMLEYKQETMPMDTREENDLIDQTKKLRHELKGAQQQLIKQEGIRTDLSDTDQAITDLFKKADEEHEKVQQLYKQSQQKHEKFMKIVNEIAASISESNKKHKEYIEIREEAQRQHEKAMEMLSKIMAVKKERQQRWKEAKDLLKTQNITTQKVLMDKNKLNEIAEGSVEELKKGKKISLSG